jgi:hypothetical protein
MNSWVLRLPELAHASAAVIQLTHARDSALERNDCGSRQGRPVALIHTHHHGDGGSRRPSGGAEIRMWSPVGRSGSRLLGRCRCYEPPQTEGEGPVEQCLSSSLSDLIANPLILLKWYYFLEAKLLNLFKGLKI